MRSATEKERMVPRARRCWLAQAGDPCGTMAVLAYPNGGSSRASPWLSAFLVLYPW